MTTNGQDEGLEPFAEEVFSGNGAAVERLRLQVARISPYFRTVLLTGERGVGKLTVARQIHRLSPVANRPFGAMEAAEFGRRGEGPGLPGTVYLKGVEGLNLELQEALLKRLKMLGRETRVVLASECDLRGVVAAGRMRQELYQYAATLEIRVAPLRERLDDLAELSGAMLGRRAGGGWFSAAALDRMGAYGWPGNLHELWVMCGDMAWLGGEFGVGDLPRLDGRVATGAPVVRLDAVMLRHVMDVLQQCSGNKLKAAELLGISRSTLYRMLESASV